MRLPVRLLLAACLLSTLLAGCRSDANTKISVNRNGSGVMEFSIFLDKDVVAALPTDNSFLHLSDLSNAGWNYGGSPVHERDGISITAKHPFTNADQATELLHSVARPLEGVDVKFSHNLLYSSVNIVGSVDLTTGMAAFGSDAQRKILGNIDPALLQKFLGGSTSDAVGMTLQVSMAGKAKTIDIPLGKITRVKTSQSMINPALIWFILGVVLLAIAYFANLGARNRGRYKNAKPDGRYAASDS